jgi:hypothetical protein
MLDGGLGSGYASLREELSTTIGSVITITTGSPRRRLLPWTGSTTYTGAPATAGWLTINTRSELAAERTGSPALVTTATRSGAEPGDCSTQFAGAALDNGRSQCKCLPDAAWAPAPISNAPATAALTALIRFNIRAPFLQNARCDGHTALHTQSAYQRAFSGGNGAQFLRRGHREETGLRKPFPAS